MEVIMSPYRVSDLIGVRLFTTSSAAALECEINQWLKGNPDKKVLDIVYQHSRFTKNDETYSCLVSYAQKEYEASM